MGNGELLERAREALAALLPGRRLRGLALLGQGHINDTLLVSFAGGEPSRAVLQRLNRAVFPEPEKIMANLAVLADHLDRRLAREPTLAPAWPVLRPLGGRPARPFFLDAAGDCWRLLPYVEGEVGREPATVLSAGEAGRALGTFHRLVDDLDPSLLFDTLPGFHCTPDYLAAYDALPWPGPVSPEETRCREVIEAHRDLAPVLEEARRVGRLWVRVTHGDPRLANMLFDRSSGRVVALIDLDTVKPGLLLHDLGDCLRSCCNPGEEESAVPAATGFSLDLCRAVLAGYLAAAGTILAPAELELIYPALRLLAFELGLRFFSDHLAGDRYFRIDRPGHNLARALGQFRLLAAIEAQEGEIRQLVGEWCAV